MQHNRFSRLISLIGEEKYNSLSKKTILIVGLGGVGGYVVESLARCGISNIIIVDFDTVDCTNINRQIIALESTIGLKKVDLFEKRIKDINPECNIIKHDIFLDKTNISEVFDRKIDYIIDACDSMDTKKILIKISLDMDIPIVSSMGTANKFDPKRLEIIDIRKTYNDPVARIMRKYIKDLKVNRKIMVLSSSELPQKNGKILASNSFVPPSAGLLIGNYVFNELINK